MLLKYKMFVEHTVVQIVPKICNDYMETDLDPVVFNFNYLCVNMISDFMLYFL